MSFLLEDEILAKLLIESGLIDQHINKFAQDQTTVISLAKKMVDSLVEPTGLPEIHMRDVENLDAFLNHLFTTNYNYNGNPVVLSANTDMSAFNKNNYVEYNLKNNLTGTLQNKIFVYKDALVTILKQLEEQAGQTNKVAAALIKNIIREANSNKMIDAKIETKPTQTQQQSSKPTEQSVPQAGNKDVKQVSYKQTSETSEPAQFVYDVKNNEQLWNQLQTMPFTKGMIDLARMATFMYAITGMMRVSKVPEDFRLYANSFTNAAANFQNIYAAWLNVASKSINQGVVNSERVKYNEMTYGNDASFLAAFPAHQFATEAAQVLLNAVHLCVSILEDLNDSYTGKAIINEGVLTEQRRLAENYIARLQNTIKYTQQG